LAKSSGVTGFTGTSAYDVTSQQVRYVQDVRLLPYTLRNHEQQVLSRWHMAKPTPTVSREQCKVQVFADGAAALISCGKSPTLWRMSGGPWYAVSRDETCPLTHGDQISLDCNDCEAAVFTCQLDGTVQQTNYAQQQGGYSQQYDVSQEGYEQGLPSGWTIGVDPASGASYYCNEQTGQSQWERPC
jgi:hypothetical protein